MASVQISTGLAVSLLGGGSYNGDFNTIFGGTPPDHSELRIFGYKYAAASVATHLNDMTPPATADEVLTLGSTFGGARTLILIATLTSSGPLEFDIAGCTSNYLDKDSGDTWTGTTVYPDTPDSTTNVLVPVFWRLCLNVDGNTASTTLPRVQGDIRSDLSGAGVLSAAYLAQNVAQTLDVFRIALPLTSA